MVPVASTEAQSIAIPDKQSSALQVVNHYDSVSHCPNCHYPKCLSKESISKPDSNHGLVSPLKGGTQDYLKT